MDSVQTDIAGMVGAPVGGQTVDGQTVDALSVGGRSVGLTESAAKRVAVLAEKEGNPALMLRLAVSGGGCSGFQYGFSFDDRVNDDDHVYSRGPARLVVDEVSLDLLAGAEVDFVEDLMGSYFKVQNPNASSSCGCGSSFAI